MIFAAAVLLVFGIGETRNAEVDVFPEFAPPMVEIQTLAVGNSSKQVEELITVPLEDQLSGIPGLEEMRSKSVDRKSTRLNSSHANISYAVFCLKKKKKNTQS